LPSPVLRYSLPFGLMPVSPRGPPLPEMETLLLRARAFLSFGYAVRWLPVSYFPISLCSCFPGKKWPNTPAMYFLLSTFFPLRFSSIFLSTYAKFVLFKSGHQTPSPGVMTYASLGCLFYPQTPSLPANVERPPRADFLLSGPTLRSEFRAIWSFCYSQPVLCVFSSDMESHHNHRELTDSLLFSLLCSLESLCSPPPRAKDGLVTSPGVSSPCPILFRPTPPSSVCFCSKRHTLSLFGTVLFF